VNSRSAQFKYRERLCYMYALPAGDTAAQQGQVSHQASKLGNTFQHIPYLIPTNCHIPIKQHVWLSQVEK